MRTIRNKKWLLAGVALLLLSCSNRPKEVLSMKEMTDVLVDLHTLDGILGTEEYRSLKQEEKDKYYEAVLEGHSIHQAQFDSSLVWYSRDPKKFEKIYVRVVDRLTAEEEAVKAGKYHLIEPQNPHLDLASVNLWKGSARFELANDSLSRRQPAIALADTALMTGDRYELHFRRRVAPEDSCAGQHLHFNLHYAGGAVDSIYLPSYADGKMRRYTLRLNARRKEKIDSLVVCFFATDSCLYGRRAYVDSISLIRRYEADKQEELRTLTEQHEAVRTFKYRLFPMPGEKTDFIFRKVRVNL